MPNQIIFIIRVAWCTIFLGLLFLVFKESTNLPSRIHRFFKLICLYFISIKIRIHRGVWRSLGVWKCRCQWVDADRGVDSCHKGIWGWILHTNTCVNENVGGAEKSRKCCKQNARFQFLMKPWSSATTNKDSTSSSKGQRWDIDSSTCWQWSWLSKI